MATDREKRLRLKAALGASDIVLAPGCGDVVTARLVESCGVAAIHASGSVAHRTSGYADAGFLTLTEMTDSIRALNEGIGIPVIADADTGFGSAANVVRTVKEYERAGAAAIHIEDQLTPKRPTHLGYGGNFITRAEMVDKIRAAVDTRQDENLLIISRCDVDDWDEKLERLAACRDAGADCGWIASREADKIEELTKAVGTPCIGVLPPGMTGRSLRADPGGVTDRRFVCSEGRAGGADRNRLLRRVSRRNAACGRDAAVLFAAGQRGIAAYRGGV